MFDLKGHSVGHTYVFFIVKARKALVKASKLNILPSIIIPNN